MRAWGPMFVSSHPRSDYQLSCFPQTRRCRRGQGWGQGWGRGADSAASRSAAGLPKLRARLWLGGSARSWEAAAGWEVWGPHQGAPVLRRAGAGARSALQEPRFRQRVSRASAWRAAGAERDRTRQDPRAARVGAGAPG